MSPNQNSNGWRTCFLAICIRYQKGQRFKTPLQIIFSIVTDAGRTLWYIVSVPIVNLVLTPKGFLADTSSHKSQLSRSLYCPISSTGSHLCPWGACSEAKLVHAFQLIQGHVKVLRPQCGSKSSLQISLFGRECFKTQVCFPWQRYPPLDAISSWHFRNCFMSVFSIRTVQEVRTEITVLRMLTLAYRVTHKSQTKYLHPGQPASAMINKLGCHTGDCTASAPGQSGATCV